MSQRYELRGKIGQGGIGTVHKAFDNQLKRDVAIKRLLPSEEGASPAESAENLLKEATTLSALQHPNIVTVYDVGTDDKGAFVVMELLKGETFDETIARGALTYEDFRLVVTQTLEALIAAHHVGLIHRDLKPSNLMVNWMPSGKFQIKILDFGLAKFSKQPSVQTIDQGDAILGSIYFMAPEQFERIPLDVRTDLYSMGCMYYQCLTGKYPFDGDSAPQVMASHLQNRVTPLGKLRPDIPSWACDWVMWLISRKMDDRPASAKLAYKQFQNEKGSPAYEAAAEAAAAEAAAAAAALQAPLQTAPAGQMPVGAATAPLAPGQTFPHPGGMHPVAGQIPGQPGFAPGVAGAPPRSIAAKPSFPKWAMFTIPVLLAVVIGIAWVKFGGRGEKKKRNELVVKLHEQIDAGETPKGNAETVGILFEHMIDSPENQKGVVRILEKLGGDGVDAAIVENLPEIESPVQLQAVLYIIGERKYKAGIRDLMPYASHKDQQVRANALASIVALGGKQQIPPLLDLVVASVEASGRHTYTDAIHALAKKIPEPDQRTEAIRSAAERNNGEVRGALLELLGPLGGIEAWQTVKKALDGGDEKAKIGALRGLAKWPDSRPSETLYKLAKDNRNSNVQFVAVHAYVTNVALPSPVSAQSKVDKLKEVFSHIERKKEKQILLQALGMIIDPSAKKLAEDLGEEDASIKPYAVGAAARIKEGLKNLAVVKDEVYLEAESAQLDGYEIRYNKDQKMRSISSWTQLGDRVHWPVRFEEAGKFAIYATQSCPEDDKDNYEVAIAGETIIAEVISTGDSKIFKTEKIGEVRISEPGGYTLTVSARSLDGDLLMHLKQIRIRKIE